MKRQIGSEAWEAPMAVEIGVLPWALGECHNGTTANLTGTNPATGKAYEDCSNGARAKAGLCITGGAKA